jgi:hypothetical protein
VPLRVTEVEQLKKKVRKMAAGRVLVGDSVDASLDIAAIDGCRAQIVAGYGTLTQTRLSAKKDRLIWLLDGYAEIHGTDGQVTHVRQGESTVLRGNTAYKLVFPTLSLYVSVKATEDDPC